MSGYVLVIIWIALCAIFGFSYKAKRYEWINGEQVYRTNMFFAILAFVPVIIWAGFRDGAGYADTNAYISMYSTYPESFSGIFTVIKTVEKDVGFAVLGTIIKSLFGSNYTPFILIIAIIQGGVIITFFRRYSENYLISIFLFIATSEYFSWMFNGIRQFLAVVMIIACTPWILEKKYFRTIIVILIAATIHQTALLMLPVIFIVQGKPWSKKSITVIVLAVIVLFAADQFTNILDTMLSNTQYSNTVSTWIQEGDDGSNPIRVVVYSIPTIFAFVWRKQLGTQNALINVCINMSIISTALYIISMATSGIMIGRLPIYVSLYNYILLPYEINHVFNKESARLVQVLMVVFYLLYYYYIMHFAYGRI